MTYTIAADIGWLAPMIALAILLTGATLGALGMAIMCMRSRRPEPTDVEGFRRLWEDLGRPTMTDDR